MEKYDRQETDKDKLIRMTKKESIEKDRVRVLEHLKSIPIIRVVCKKSGISPATYYRWRNEDPEFLRLSEEALQEGVEMINDLSESQLINHIKENKLPAVQFWLRNNHPRFLSRDRNHSSVKPRQDIPLSKEQEKNLKEALKFFT